MTEAGNLSKELVTANLADASEGMSYLETLPQRIVTTWIPLGLILIVLLFPFARLVHSASGIFAPLRYLFARPGYQIVRSRRRRPLDERRRDFDERQAGRGASTTTLAE